MGVPKQCISEAKAAALFQKWTENQGEHLKKNLGFQDNRDFWWSLKDLQEYLDYVKQKSEEEGITNPGIRIYLGAYTKTEGGYKEGHGTLFLCPTGSAASRTEGDHLAKQNNYNIQAFNHGNNGHPPQAYNPSTSS